MALQGVGVGEKYGTEHKDFCKRYPFLAQIDFSWSRNATINGIVAQKLD